MKAILKLSYASILDILLVEILVFLLARLKSDWLFGAPGQYFDFICQKNRQQGETPFCCRLLPTNIAGNKRKILRLCMMRETRTRREEAIILLKLTKY